MTDNKKSKIDSEFVKQLTDEELNRIAGGGFGSNGCPSRCMYRNNACECPDPDYDD